MTENFSLKARELVLDCINAQADAENQVDLDDVFLVWFCKTLQNWKALVGATGFHWYFEVTHNGDTGETYIDVYSKSRQIIAITAPGRIK